MDPAVPVVVSDRRTTHHRHLDLVLWTRNVASLETSTDSQVLNGLDYLPHCAEDVTMQRILIPLLLAVFLVLSACGKPKAVISAATVDEFVKSYQAAYEANTREPLMLLTSWKDVPSELRDFTKEQVFPFSGQREIRSIETVEIEDGVVEPREHDGKKLVPNLTPLYQFVIIFEPERRGGTPERFKVIVGQVEGELMLCGWKPADQ